MLQILTMDWDQREMIQRNDGFFYADWKFAANNDKKNTNHNNQQNNSASQITMIMSRLTLSQISEKF